MRSILISIQKDKDLFWLTPSNIENYDYLIDNHYIQFYEKYYFLYSSLILICFLFCSISVNGAVRSKPIIDIEEGTTITEEERRKVI